MDKRKSILNVTVSVGFRLITMIMVIAVKRLLIQICGNEVNGLNALYLSITGFLSVAELGVGSAITFGMYRPIVEGNTAKVSALYGLFHRLYWAIGCLILLAGVAITPFLPKVAADYVALDVNLYVTFLLMLMSVVLTYFFGAKTALINAYKNNYITTAINSCGIVLQYILQILVLLTLHSFEAYLICRSIAVLVQWGITDYIARRKYGGILTNRQKIDDETKTELIKNTKAMFMHKVGMVLVNTVDSVIISAFVGVAVLGKYSNYTTILAAITGVIKLVFSSLTSVFGHLYVEQPKHVVKQYCEMFHVLNFALGAVIYLGYFAVIDNLIAILFSPDLIVSRSIAVTITLNEFVQFLRSSVSVFRDATGTFYYDRWKPLLEGITNMILSIMLIRWMGVPGVLAATIITNLLICHVIEPYVLYRKAFEVSPLKYYLKNYSMVALFSGMLAIMRLLMQQGKNHWSEFLINGWISVGISVIGCVIVALADKNTRNQIMCIIRKRGAM